MKEVSNYDSMFIFKTPISWTDDNGELIKVYGIMYHSSNHIFEDFYFDLKVRMCMLIGSHKIWSNGGKVKYAKWTTPSGRELDLSKPRLRELLVQLLGMSMPFRMMEFENPIKYNDYELYEDLIISRDLIERVDTLTRTIQKYNETDE